MTRKEEVTKMLQRASGATTAQIAAKTGMQEHSARALISQLGVTVTTSKTKGKPTVYRIVEEAKAAA